MFTIQDACNYDMTRFQFDASGNLFTTREAQALLQMINWLMNSHSPECLNKVCHSSENQIVVSPIGEVTEDGPFIFAHHHVKSSSGQ